MKRLAIKHAEHKQTMKKNQNKNRILSKQIYIPQSDTVFVNSF